MKSVLERLWKDKMDIYRFNSITVNNVTKNAEQMIETGIKCHYSSGSMADTGDTGVPELVSSHKLFCPLGTDIKSGDRVVITQRNGNIVNVTIGEGFPYSHGLQFSVKRSDIA